MCVSVCQSTVVYYSTVQQCCQKGVSSGKFLHGFTCLINHQCYKLYQKKSRYTRPRATLPCSHKLKIHTVVLPTQLLTKDAYIALLSTIQNIDTEVT